MANLRILSDITRPLLWRVLKILILHRAATFITFWIFFLPKKFRTYLLLQKTFDWDFQYDFFISSSSLAIILHCTSWMVLMQIETSRKFMKISFQTNNHNLIWFFFDYSRSCANKFTEYWNWTLLLQSSGLSVSKAEKVSLFLASGFKTPALKAERRKHTFFLTESAGSPKQTVSCRQCGQKEKKSKHGFFFKSNKNSKWQKYLLSETRKGTFLQSFSPKWNYQFGYVISGSLRRPKYLTPIFPWIWL